MHSLLSKGRVRIYVKIATDADGNFSGVYGKNAKGDEIVRNPVQYNKMFEAVPVAKDLPK